ncbi:TPA: matrix protein [Tapajos virus]|uniref:Matrix protein VP40 n=1 Tax=Tapajos virus TaxID=2840185 RepID=A0AAD3AVY7_9MONO|nr:matrix protein [Tapajos virus]FAA04059.1 TPA: matrix protein [Tapajos virus]
MSAPEEIYIRPSYSGEPITHGKQKRIYSFLLEGRLSLIRSDINGKKTQSQYALAFPLGITATTPNEALALVSFLMMRGYNVALFGSERRPLIRLNMEGSFPVAHNLPILRTGSRVAHAEDVTFPPILEGRANLLVQSIQIFTTQLNTPSDATTSNLTDCCGLSLTITGSLSPLIIEAGHAVGEGHKATATSFLSQKIINKILSTLDNITIETIDTRTRIFKITIKNNSTTSIFTKKLKSTNNTAHYYVQSASPITSKTAPRITGAMQGKTLEQHQ